MSGQHTTLQPASMRGATFIGGAIMSIIAYGWFGTSADLWGIAGVMMGVIGLMSVGGFLPRFSTQVLVRGGLLMKLTWLTFVLGTLFYTIIFENTSIDRLWSTPALITWMLFGGVGTMALSLGKRGLSERSPHFAPHSNKGPLMFSLIMGVADTLLLALGFVMMIVAMFSGSMPSASSMATVAGLLAGMGTALYGVYRLRVWGTVLMLLMNVAVVGAIAHGVGLDKDMFLATPFIITTLVQFGLFARLMKMIRASSATTTAHHVHAPSMVADVGGSGVVFDGFESSSRDATHEEATEERVATTQTRSA